MGLDLDGIAAELRDRAWQRMMPRSMLILSRAGNILMRSISSKFKR